MIPLISGQYYNRHTIKLQEYMNRVKEEVIMYIEKLKKEKYFERLREKGLYIVKGDEVERCVNISVDSLSSDNSIKYLMGDISHREKFALYNRVNIKTFMENGYLIAPSEKIEGFMLIIPPDAKFPSPYAFVRNGIIEVILKLGIGAIGRALKYEMNCKHIKKKSKKGNCWYIFMFGVDPDFQGTGIGSRIMKPFLDFLDEERQGCYLETHKEVNTEIYKHYGFQIVDRGRLPDGNAPQYAMYRKVKKIR